MKTFSIISLAVLGYPIVAATSIPRSARKCVEYSIPLTVTAPNLVPAFPIFKDSFDVVDLVNQAARRDVDEAFHPFPLSDPPIVTANVTIAATFCTPKYPNGYEKTVLLASHGLGFDRRYWDSAFQASNYSFVDYAIGRGYSVFFYDRLGTGKSSEVSGYVAQAPAQLVILAQLTGLLRNSKYTDKIVPSKIIHVGHSFGSFLSHALLATFPSLSDGAVLTGIAYLKNGSGTSLEAFALRIAKHVNPLKWATRDTGYVTWADISGFVAAFFKAGTFDNAALAWAQDKAMPLAITEALTIPVLPLDAANFTGPVMVLSGEFDFAVCGGNCAGILDGPAKAIFAKGKNVKGIVHPNVGHGINFSFNATGAYKTMIDYIVENGL